jgi:hypothetical protein
MLGPRVERRVDVTIYACRRLSKPLLACQHMRVQLLLQPDSCFLMFISTLRPLARRASPELIQFGTSWAGSPQPGGAGCGPAVRLGRRRHVDHFEEIAGLVQRGDCATTAGVNSEDATAATELRHPRTGAWRSFQPRSQQQVWQGRFQRYRERGGAKVRRANPST